MTSSEKPDETVVNNLSEIQQRISAAEQGRSIPGSPVELVAVSKMHGMDRIQNALDAGHRVFGENRVQEAQKKWTGQRSKYPDLSLHLIGPLQTNKAADAVDLLMSFRRWTGQSWPGRWPNISTPHPAIPRA